MTRLIGTLVCWLAWCGLGLAAERAAYVENATPGSIISRGNQDLTPAILMPLFAGDIVKLETAASVVRIVRGENKIQELRGPGRFTIEPGPASGSFETLSWIWERIRPPSGDEISPNLVSKGDGIMVPAAPAGGMIARGADPVVLVWSGGKAPYWVSVGRARYKADTPRLDFAIPAGAGKRLRIEIKDEHGAFTRLTLRVADAAPMPPAEIAALPGTVDLRRTAAAAWLARQPRWRLEALRRLSLLKSYEPAQKLFTALAAGR